MTELDSKHTNLSVSFKQLKDDKTVQALSKGFTLQATRSTFACSSILSQFGLGLYNQVASLRAMM